MRKFLSVGLVILNAAGASSNVQAARQASTQTATLTGSVRQTDSSPLSSASVRVRSVATGAVVASTTTGPLGEFLAAGVQPGSYIVEVLDQHGRIVGTTSQFTVQAGAAVEVSVVAVASGTVSKRGGFSIFGLGPATSMAVLGAASAAAVTAVIVTRPEASPSR